MIHLRCFGCNRYILSVDSIESKTGQSPIWNVRAKCGYRGCQDHSNTVTVVGKLYPQGYYDGPKRKTVIVGQELDESNSLITFETVPSDG